MCVDTKFFFRDIMAPTIMFVEDATVIEGPMYLAVYTKLDEWGAPRQIGGVVFPSQMEGDMTIMKFKNYAFMEGCDMYTKELLGADEKRPWIDLKGDLLVGIDEYEQEVRKCMVGGHEPTVKPIIMENPCSYESFLMYLFKQGCLKEERRLNFMMNSGHPMPMSPIYIIPDSQDENGLEVYGIAQVQKTTSPDNSKENMNYHGHEGYNSGTQPDLEALIYDQSLTIRLQHDEMDKVTAKTQMLKEKLMLHELEHKEAMKSSLNEIVDTLGPIIMKEVGDITGDETKKMLEVFENNLASSVKAAVLGKMIPVENMVNRTLEDVRSVVKLLEDSMEQSGNQKFAQQPQNHAFIQELHLFGSGAPLTQRPVVQNQEEGPISLSNVPRGFMSQLGDMAQGIHHGFGGPGFDDTTNPPNDI